LNLKLCEDTFCPLGRSRVKSKLPYPNNDILCCLSYYLTHSNSHLPHLFDKQCSSWHSILVTLGLASMWARRARKALEDKKWTLIVLPALVSGEAGFQVSPISVDNQGTTQLVKIEQSWGNQYMRIRGGFLLDLFPPTRSTWKDNSKLSLVAPFVNLTNLAHMEAGPYWYSWHLVYDMSTWIPLKIIIINK